MIVGKIFAWLLGLALFNFVLFTVCFFWTEIAKVIITPQGMGLALLVAACFCVPLAIIHYVQYRKKEDYRKLRIRQKVDAIQQKEIGIDF
jgi:membrane protein CcdC involved in cytochrome C biogenesis